MDIRIEVKPDNPGNEAMRAAFLKRGDESLHGVESLAELLKVTGSTAYKMCEPLGEYGSGTPSIAAYWFEVLRTRHVKDVKELRDFSIAEELAFTGVLWVRRLRNGNGGGDFTRSVGLLVTHAAAANFKAHQRPLAEMSLNEMRDAREDLQQSAIAAERALATLDAAIQARESSCTGAPIQAEHAARRAG